MQISTNEQSDQIYLILKNYIFKSHDNTETKIVKGFSYSMLPSGSYQIDAGCFNKPVIDCKHYYLAKVEAL